MLADITKQRLSFIKDIPHTPNAVPTFLPVYLNGGIGDVILAIDSLKELSSRYDCVFYTKHIEALKYFWPEARVEERLHNLTWHLEFDTLVSFKLNYGFSGFTLKEHEELFEAQMNVFSQDPCLGTLAESFSKRYYLIAEYAKELGLTRRSMPLYSLLGLKSKPLFGRYPRAQVENYITVHDGFDVQHRGIVASRCTKTWNMEGWEEFVSRFKSANPGVRIIQLGRSETARPIKGVDECLIDKTTLAQAFEILSHARFHVDGDSGLVHAAARLSVPSIVLWGPTPWKFYGYDENFNIRTDVCDGKACYGLTDDWNSKCPLGYKTPACMDSVTPTHVIIAALRLIHSDLDKPVALPD